MHTRLLVLSKDLNYITENTDGSSQATYKLLKQKNIVGWILYSNTSNYGFLIARITRSYVDICYFYYSCQPQDAEPLIERVVNLKKNTIMIHEDVHFSLLNYIKDKGYRAKSIDKSSRKLIFNKESK